MASKQFLNYVQQELDSYKEMYGFKDNRRAFEPWALQYLLGVDKDIAVNNTDTLAQGDNGLDGWYYDSDNNIFHLFQMKYPDNHEDEYGGTAGDELIKFYEKLIDDTYNFKNEKSKLVYNSYREAHNPEIKVKLNIVVYSNFAEQRKNTISEDINRLRGNPLFEIYDIEKLFQFYVDEDDLEDLAGESIAIEILNGQYLEIEPKNKEVIGKAAVVTIKSLNFAKIVKEKYPKIVAKNVRFHLGNKKNQGMVDLLNNENESYKFWYYNNGLTILCDNWSINTQDSTIEIENPQIINGGQTSKTLSQNISVLKNDIYVLAKIIKLGSNKEIGQEEGLKISETSNTQNKVSIADLKSLCPIQKAIKANFNHIEPAWFYEIKSKEWNVLTTSDKKKYDKRKLNKTDIGQEWRMVNENPIKAISNKEEMYNISKLYTKVFSADRNVYEYLYAHQIVNLFNELISEKNLDELQKYDPKISPEILTRILSAKKLSVGYLSYLLNQALQEENSNIDYEVIYSKLNTDIDYFTVALKVIIMSFRSIIVQVDQNESLLSNIRQQQFLENCKIKFMDNYSLMTQFGSVKLFN